MQRSNNRVSTDKLLAEICLDTLPKTKIPLKSRLDNRHTSISTQVTAESLKIIDAIISSSKILKNLFQNLEEQGAIPNKKLSNVKSIVIRAALCYFLKQLDNLQKNPQLYQRAVTLQSSENILKKIYQEKFGGSKN